jgi:hypothetical protein
MDRGRLRRLAGGLLAISSVIMVSGCNLREDDPLIPIRVRLAWDTPVDLDLLVDEDPAYRQGGSSDQQTAGMESFEINRGIGTYVIAVQNLSGHASARPVVTVEGARELEESTLSSDDKPVEMVGAVEPNARRDRWIVCEIDAEKGKITRIGRWE